MASLFSDNTQTFPAPYGTPHLIGLMQKGLVRLNSGSFLSNAYPHFIPDFVWEAMQKNHEHFALTDEDVAELNRMRG